MSALRVKIFFGTRICPADEALDAWLDEHPNYELIKCHMIYPASGINEHALLVMYSERVELESYDQSGDAESAEREK